MMSSRVGFVYSDKCNLHRSPGQKQHVENPRRLTEVVNRLTTTGLTERCVLVEPRQAKEDELALVHTRPHINKVKLYSDEDYLTEATDEEGYPTYVCSGTFEAASWSVGSGLAMVDAVMQEKVNSGFVACRPPGHHAGQETSGGFCFFNNVAIATRYAQKQYGVERVLILDWDIHHGDGTQAIFYEDPSVLYLSIHRYDHGVYYPHKPGVSGVESVGSGKGEGCNINIAWNQDKMGDSEYMKAFDRVVEPVINQYHPDLILVSAGFDAREGDELGQYQVTDRMYSYMTGRLQELAPSKLILFQEGGYHPENISKAAASCVARLLGEASDQTFRQSIKESVSEEAEKTLLEVKNVHSKYWKIDLK